nr:thioredoxin fold domain-containing protein [uncultured Chryseobacterium sp.]
MKNRKFLKAAVIIIPIILTGILTCLFLSFKKKEEKIEALKNLPAFSLETIHHTLLTSKSLVNNHTKVIIYFSPTCHYCQAEAEELFKVHRQYKNIQWIWVASESLEEIKQFAFNNNLNNQPNIFWCHDEKATFYQKLGMKGVPYFLVYDKNNNLIKRNSGAIKLEKLVTFSDEKK